MFTTTPWSHSESNSSSSSNSDRKSWKSYKEEGKRYYDQELYEQALQAFQTSLRIATEATTNNQFFVSVTKNDRQVLLSNIVACRLKLASVHNDINQANLAIKDAKECIAIEPTWSKGHVRLASAYIAAQTISSSSPTETSSRINYSNDACNALQTALRYDPSNTMARQMLIRELRSRDNHHSNNANQSSTGRDPPINPNYQPPSISSSNGSQTHNMQNQEQQRRRPPSANGYDDVDYDGQRNDGHHPYNNNNGNNNIGNGLKNFIEVIGNRIRQFINTIVQTVRTYQIWYENQSSDFQTGLQLLALLLFVYIAFGGRFGLDKLFRRLTTGSPGTNINYRTTQSTSSTSTGGSSTKGNYGAGNAYDEYRRQAREQHQQQQQQQQQQQTYSNYGYGGGAGGSSSYNYNDPFASFGGFQNVAMIGFVLYICHRNGIHPLNALMMINMMNGRGGGGIFHYGGFGGGGFGRGRYHHRFGGRPRW